MSGVTRRARLRRTRLQRQRPQDTTKLAMSTLDNVKPPWIVWHKLPLKKAPEACANFAQRKNGWTKVVLKPGKSK